MRKESRRISVISFSLFSTWLIAFPYQGKVFYSLIAESRLDAEKMVLAGLICLVAGLSGCGFLRSIWVAKLTMLYHPFSALPEPVFSSFPPSALLGALLRAILFAVRY
jgi:hypothetical protein